MFPDARDQGASPGKRADHTRLVFWALVCAVIICLAAASVLIVQINHAKTTPIPKAITQAVKTPIYLPTNLPGNYKVDSDSFRLAENNTVLTFYARDGVGANLIFSEQPKPRDFKFDEFYKDNFTDARTISNVPFPSVWGKSLTNQPALSIVTEDTWVLVTTSAPLSHEDMSYIAAHIQKR